MAGPGHADTPVGRLAHWLDVRLGAAKFARSKINYVFPEHFSFLFGEVALYSFVVLVGTGVFLSLFYTPSEAHVVYEGSYAPLHGVRVTEAYRSVVDLSFDVRAGLLMRQTHHWAALVFLGAIVAHLSRVFFTGAFRRPRELNWITGVALLAAAMFEGFLGYSLLDDLLSGEGLRIAYSTLQSVPVVGTWAAFLSFGGEYPGTGLFGRMFVAHIFVLPAVLAGLIAVHLALIVRQKHTQFAGRGRTEHNVVGTRLWPVYATRSTGLFFIVAGVVALMGGLLQINPVWLYGPYEAFLVTSGSQADWYVLWVQGALRLFPPWELQLFGYTVATQFFPGVAVPGAVFALLFAWPFLEARLTGDRGAHHLLDRPRDHPLRTAVGTAALAFFAILLLAGSDDVVAATFDWSITAMRYTERVLVVLLPAAVGAATYRICGDLAARGEPEETPGREEADRSGDGSPARARPRDAPAPGSRRLAGWRRRAVTAGAVAAVAGALADRLRRRSD